MTNKITKDNVTQKQQHSVIKDLDQLQALSEDEQIKVVGGCFGIEIFTSRGINVFGVGFGLNWGL